MHAYNFIKYNFLLPGLLLLFGLLGSSCASTRNKTSHTSSPIKQQAVNQLSPEAQRQYDYFFLEAMRMKQKGNYDATFELLRHCLQLNPQAASALYEISQFYLALKKEEQAEQSMKKAVQAEPNNFWYQQILAAYYQQSTKFDKAIEVYEQMANQFPNRPEVLMALTELYSRVNKYPEMIHSLDRLETIQGKSEEISMNKFRVYLLMNDQGKAFEEMENLAQEYPYDLRYRTVLGDLYLNNDKPEEAYSTYRKVLDQEPDNPMALISLANYYEKTKQDELYRQQLDTILLKNTVTSNTKLEILRQCIVRSEQTDRDSTQIIALFDRALQQPQTDAQLYMLYTQYLVSKNMLKESVPVLNQILAIDPENTAARMQLLGYAIRDNDPQEVIRVCKPATEYTPEILEFHFYLSLAYLQTKQEDEAIAALEKGIGQGNEQSDKKMMSDLYSFLGDLYHNKQEEVKAYAAYDSALVYNPDNVLVLNNYAYFLSLENKQLDKAEEMSYRTIKAEPKNATYLDTYAWILFIKGRYTEAKLYIDSALQNGGMESPDELEHAGDIYFHCNDREKALEFWKKAKELGVESKTIDQKIKLKKYIKP